MLSTNSLDQQGKQRIGEIKDRIRAYITLGNTDEEVFLRLYYMLCFHFISSLNLYQGIDVAFCEAEIDKRIFGSPCVQRRRLLKDADDFYRKKVFHGGKLVAQKWNNIDTENTIQSFCYERPQDKLRYVYGGEIATTGSLYQCVIFINTSLGRTIDCLNMELAEKVKHIAKILEWYYQPGNGLFAQLKTWLDDVRKLEEVNQHLDYLDELNLKVSKKFEALKSRDHNDNAEE